MADIWPTSMVVPPELMMSLEPRARMNTMLKYTHICISGPLRATIRSALVKSAQISWEAAANFCFSYSSRVKPFTTRMALTFSSMDSLSLSYLLNTARKAGMALRAIISRPKMSTGTTMTKVVARLPPMM